MRYLLYYIFLISCNSKDNGDLSGRDYRLFEDTPVWELAKAVKEEDVDKIRKIVKEEKLNVDYQEPKYGNTLLMLTVDNQHYNSCKTLLELNADPNVHDNYNGSSAMIDAARIENFKNDNTDFLKLILLHGGNPNDEEIGKQQEGNTTRNTPLLAACCDVNQFVSPLEKIKVLVEAGANIDYKNEYNMTPIRKCLINEHFDVILYLIQKGANYKSVISSVDGKDYYLWDELRLILLPLDSEKYKQKMAIVEFLKQQGIDYRKLPIPDYAKSQAKKMYPGSWKKYLEKY